MKNEHSEKPADGLGTQLRRLLELLDGDVEAIYNELAPGYIPRYTPIMKALSSGEPLSIKEIAERSSVSHSAASQTISKMTREGLVATQVDEDNRYRSVTLTEQGQELLPLLRKQWQATNKAADALDRELKHPLSEVVAEAIEKLEQKSFRDRIKKFSSRQDR